MTPELASTILMDLDNDDALRELFVKQGHLTTKQIAAVSWTDANITTVESRGIVTLLKKAGWRLVGRRLLPPKDHPIRMAPDVESNDSDKDRVRLMVGRSSIPPEYHAEAVHGILNNPRTRVWTRSPAVISRQIQIFKKKIEPPKESEDDTLLREDIVEWLNDPETQALVSSRPHRYVTPWEVIEGTMRIPDTAMLKQVSRVMPWEKRDIRVGDKVIKGYIQPTNKLTIRAEPELDTLPAYIADRLVVSENEVLRDVCKLSARQVVPSDRTHVRTAMRSLGWKRQRSLHGAGWIYMQQESA